MASIRKPGHRQGVRRYQRYDQMGLGITGTLAYSISDEEEEAEIIAFTGTCQTCGSYWDVRQYERCPATRDGERCNGYLG